MTINDILPIVVPGMIIQVLIQAYYIKHCWENKRLTQKQKALYIITIAIFNVPAAAIYLFLTRKRSEDNTNDLKDQDIDNNIKQGIFVLLIIIFQVMAFNMIQRNMSSSSYTVIIWLLAISFVIMLVDNLLVKKHYAMLFYIIPVFQIILVMLLDYFDSSASSQFIVLAVMASVINRHSLKHAKIYSIFGFCLYVIVSIIKPLTIYGSFGSDEIIQYVYVNIAVFLLVFAAFYTLKKQLLVNDRLQSALKELKEKSLKLEEMSTIAERNRITGEIHDTVGHTLTTAIVSIEAGQHLLDTDVNAARDRFTLAQQQIQRGLQDIRFSVKTIKEGPKKTFVPELHKLLDEIRNNTQLVITEITELKTELLPLQQKVLIRAIKECTTNSIKHGKSTAVDILLREYNDHVYLTFSDNGIGTRTIEFGFGLTGMEEMVNSIGGTLSVSSEIGEGLTVSISIPTGVETKGAKV